MLLIAIVLYWHCCSANKSWTDSPYTIAIATLPSIRSKMHTYSLWMLWWFLWLDLIVENHRWHIAKPVSLLYSARFFGQTHRQTIASDLFSFQGITCRCSKLLHKVTELLIFSLFLVHSFSIALSIQTVFLMRFSWNHSMFLIHIFPLCTKSGFHLPPSPLPS